MYSLPVFFFSPTNLILDIISLIVFVFPFAMIGYVLYRVFKNDNKKK